jgi:putative alpha-1,2-mannosidase
MIFLFFFLIQFYSICSIENPENFVNLLAGTFTDGRSFSTGNTLPLISRPWGFNHWSPQTAAQNARSSSWWFDGNQHTFTWMRCTHQPSPWIGDWGWFLFTPIIGGVTDNPTLYWEPRGATIKPYLFDAILAPHNIRIELTPTDHSSIMRVTFPSTNEDKKVCFHQASWDKGSSGKVIKGTYFSLHILISLHILTSLHFIL